jgi:preprotein translocase subunit SecG
MGLFHFLIVLQGIIAAALVIVILMQRSEGGGLGMGGSPSGLMSARGAADFMTRTTTILATAFIGVAVALAFVAASKGSGGKIDTSLKRVEAPLTAPSNAAPTGTTPATGAAPVAPGTAPAVAPATAAAPSAVKVPAKTDVPLDK